MRFALFLAGCATLISFSCQAASDPVLAVRNGNQPRVEARLSLIDVRVNGTSKEQLLSVLLDEASGQLWLADRDLRPLRIRIPTTEPSRVVEGERYYLMTGIQGAQFEFDTGLQRARLTLPAASFDQDQAFAAGRTPITDTGMRGYSAIATYDLYGERSNAKIRGGGIFDVAVSSPWGLLTSTQFAAQGNAIPINDKLRFRRLDTTFTADFPDRLETLRIGDFVAPGVNLGRSTRMGGVQFSTNFLVRPGFATYPLSSVSGDAVLPSVAQLFINGVAAASREVAPGPFTINDVPLLNGAGEVRLVVRDVLGRERTTFSSFYGSSQLLAEGLNDYSLSVGRLRYNFGTVSSDYRNFVTSGYWRRGVTDKLTAAVNVEVSKRVWNTGVGTTYVWPRVGEITVASAMSKINVEREAAVPFTANGKTFGHAFSIGADRRTSVYSLGARLRVASAAYRGVADGGAQFEGFATSFMRREITAYGSISLGSYGSVTASYARQAADNTAGLLSSTTTFVPASTLDTQVFAVGYNLSLGSAGQITIGASKSIERNRKQPNNTSVFANYFLPLDGLHSVSISSSRSQFQSDSGFVALAQPNSVVNNTVATIQRSLPEGEGYSYRAQVGSPSLIRLEGQLALSTAMLAIEYARSGSTQGVRASVSGAIAALGASIRVTRRIPDSFVVVEVGGFPGIRVFRDNVLVGRTDGGGRLVVPTIIAYQPHTISIEINDLPLSAEVDRTQIEISAAPRTGTIVAFPVRQARSALLRVQDELGNPVPAGAAAMIGDAAFPIAGDGALYLTGLSASNTVIVKFGTKSCRFTVLFVTSNDLLPNLGGYVCRLQ